MEFKTCEEYVLTELENIKERFDSLTAELEERDLTIQSLEMQLDEYAMKEKNNIDPHYVSILENAFDDLNEIQDYYMNLISKIVARFAISKINNEFQYSFCGLPDDEKERKEFCEALLEFKKIELEKILEDTDE